MIQWAPPVTASSDEKQKLSKYTQKNRRKVSIFQIVDGEPGAVYGVASLWYILRISVVYCGTYVIMYCEYATHVQVCQKYPSVFYCCKADSDPGVSTTFIFMGYTQHEK